jgi:hypothetical protein
MNFKYRFAYFLVGLVMGLFVISMIFSGKDVRCNYFPNARVLDNIRNKPFYYSDSAKLILSQNWIDTIDVKNTLTYGDVDFDNSNIKQENGKLYVIEGKTKQNQPIVLEIINYEDKAILKNIKKIK